MKKRIRKRPPDEIKVIVNKKLDDMQRKQYSEKEMEYFHRKPYGLGWVDDGKDM